MKKSFLSIICDQLVTVPEIVSADLSGKTVVVVGANQGLGFEAAKHFARMKPGRLILTCRDETKGEAALSELKEATGYSTGEAWLLDLAKFSSVSAFADRFEKEEGRLDVLLANAAVSTLDPRMTDDGWEEMMQVNYLSTALLCFLLLPRVVETAAKFDTNPSLALVTSELHYYGSFSREVYAAPSAMQFLNSKEYLTPSRMGPRYCETKLLEVFLVQSLAELLRDTRVIPVSVNPGLCVSSLRREFTGFRRFMVGIMERLLARTTEEGGRLLVNACLTRSDDVAKLKGAYLNINEVTEPHDSAVGEEGKKNRDVFWKELVGELSKVDGRVEGIVSSLLH